MYNYWQLERQPLLYFFISCSVGMSLQYYLSIAATEWLIMMVILLVLLSLLYGHCSRGLGLTGMILLAFAVAGGLLLAIDTARFKQQQAAVVSLTAGTTVELYGQLLAMPTVTPKGWYTTIEVHYLVTARRTLSLAHQARVTGDGPLPLSLATGSTIRAYGELEAKQSFQNPGSPDGRWWQQQGHQLLIRVTTPEILVRTSVTPLARLRQHLTQTINAHFTPLTASLLHAVLLGNSSYLSSAVKEDFRVTGLYHILVISGSHIVFLAWIAHKILQPLGKSQFLKLSLILIFIWSYTVLVGANTPVWRAALMASVLLTGRCFFRAGSEANALGLAGIVMLVSQPNAGQMVDFQLSFLAVAAILLIANPLMARLSAIGSWQLRRHTPYPPCAPTALKWIAELLFWQPQQWQASLVGHRYRLDKNPMAGWLARWQLQRLLRVSIQAIIVTAIVQVVLLPITVNQFNLVTWSGILLGVVAESLMMLLMAVALPGLLWISLAGHFNFVVIATIELLAHMFAAIAVEGHNGLGLQGWRVANLANYQAIYQWYYLPIFGLSVAINCWQPYYQPRRPPNYWLKRLIVVVALLGVLVQATIILWPAKFLALVTTPSRSLTVTFLDVGQGDAAVVRLPCRKVLVIDAGGLPHQIANATQSGYVAPRLSITPSALPPSMIGEKVVSRYLWAQGIDTIDYLIITHTDWDHLQGCGDLLRNFTVKQVVLPAIATKDAKFAALITQLRQLKIPWQCWTPATAWQFDQVHLQVLWPPRLPVVTHLDNNHSLVLRLTYGAHSFLFTGDIEAVVEAQLLTPTLNLSTSVEQNTSDNDKYDNIDNKAGPNGGIGANNLLTAANNLLTATVIKVPHHGSRTSSTSAFVQTVAPRYAVISAPRQSVFGHPHSEVIANYRQIGSKIYQTGLQGAITITTDGELLQVTCFVENSPCFYH